MKLLRTSSALQSCKPHLHRLRTPQRSISPSRRSFISAPLQHISATRSLPYPSLPIYNIIASVPSYSTFLPYCLSSKVTRWSRPDARFGKIWPEEALLEIGWGAVREQFRSRVFCVPGRIVEAVGGTTETTLAKEDILHHTVEQGEPAGSGFWTGSPKTQDQDRIMSHLLTRWSVEPEGAGARDSTRVSLDLEFQFANPLYAAMSSAVVDRVAETMIQAFEEKVKHELEGGNASELWPQDLVRG
jgi:coenzyme Q-binding protein COQ10